MSEYELKGQQTKGFGNRYKAMNSFNYTAKQAEHWVGGKLPGLAKTVFDYCFDQGLKADMNLLDFGCGCLRCSVPLIAYLDVGCYHGIDGDTGLLDIARQRIEELSLDFKQPALKSSWNFEFEIFGKNNFDWILSQGVICHMPNDEIKQLFDKIKQFLSPNGQAHLSYIDPQGKADFTHGVFEQTFDELSSFASEVGLSAIDNGPWGHPRNLKMIKLIH